MALGIFVVPVSASTALDPSLRTLAGAPLSSVSMFQGESTTFQVVVNRATGANQGVVTITPSTLSGWTFTNGSGGSAITIPAGTDRVFVEATAAHNAASGTINFQANASGASPMTASLGVTVTTGTNTWNPGVLAVPLSSTTDRIDVPANGSLNATIWISRIGAGVQGANRAVNVTASPSSGDVTIAGGNTINFAAGAELANITINVGPTTGHREITFSTAASGVVAASTTTLRINVTEGQPTGVNVTGQVTSQNPNNATTLRLMDGGNEVASTTIPVSSGSGAVTQPFTFANVPQGTYTMLVSKPSHLTTTVNNVVVGSSNVNISPMISLLAGDADGNGAINAGDLATLIANWLQPATSTPAAATVDFDGNGTVNAGDLAFIISNWLRPAPIINLP